MTKKADLLTQEVRGRIEAILFVAGEPVLVSDLAKALETLAVVAYRQPVTRAEVEQIRGVKCDYSLASLTQKGLIEEVGRKDTVGHPILFGTTDEFLNHFGISRLDQLPPLPQELQTQEEPASSEDDQLLIP